MYRVLCIHDPNKDSGELEGILETLGHEAVSAGDLEEGLAALDRADIDLVIAESGACAGRDSELTRAMRNEAAGTPLIVIQPDSPEPGLENSTDDPAAVILRVPLRIEALRDAVNRALDVSRRADPSHAAAAPEPWSARLVGESPEMKKIIGVARAVAGSAATVLIEGESGTGKELLVRAIHDGSPRASRPLIAVNCAALPEGLIESSLFGHEKGSFTGANGRFIGAFERAHGGTLLLDEISELRLDLQAKLLRAIQERQFERVGGGQAVKVDVRIVATSNRDLAAEVRAGRFRADLYYRLRVISLNVPPLRERPSDVPALVRHFVDATSRELGVEPPAVSEESLARLMSWSWPGNVRELQHATERALILNRVGPLRVDDFFPDGFRDPSAPEMEMDAAPPAGAEFDLDSILSLRDLERMAIERALHRTNGHRTRAAQLLGITDRTLRNKLKAWREEGPRPERVFPLFPAASSGPRVGRPAAGPTAHRSNGGLRPTGGANLLSDNAAA